MRDFPVFDTQNGVGSLVLKEIPYTGKAYIQIHSAADAQSFLAECVDFCQVAGAKYIYAKGYAVLEDYPVYTTIWEMAADGALLPKTDACLFPVTEKSGERWRTLYNEKMGNVPNGAYLSFGDMKRIVKEGSAYFIHRDQQLLGIGMAKNGEILAVASFVKGGGRDVLCALSETFSCDRITLQVASTNTKAIALYEQLGFLKTRELGCWYEICP